MRGAFRFFIWATTLSVAAGDAGGMVSSPPRAAATTSAATVTTSPVSNDATEASSEKGGMEGPEEARNSAAVKALQELVLVWAVNQVRARLKGSSEFNANEKNDVRLNDVLGCDEAKHELSQILEFIKHPEVRTIPLYRLPLVLS
jgi:hypothetical protein